MIVLIKEEKRGIRTSTRERRFVRFGPKSVQNQRRAPYRISKVDSGTPLQKRKGGNCERRRACAGGGTSVYSYGADGRERALRMTTKRPAYRRL